MEGISQEIKNSELTLKRLYGQYNREVIEKMKSRGMEIEEESYDLQKVLEYLKDEKSRIEKQLEDRDAMKAQMFQEWLLKNNINF